MKHMTVLLGLAFLLSNVTSAITQDRSSPETALQYYARRCAEQKIPNFTPPEPPSESGVTWDDTWDVNKPGHGYCEDAAARPLRDAIRQYKDVGGQSGLCSKGKMFAIYNYAHCTCYEHRPQCWVKETRKEWGNHNPDEGQN
jgi:hypothetical protein